MPLHLARTLSSTQVLHISGKTWLRQKRKLFLSLSSVLSPFQSYLHFSGPGTSLLFCLRVFREVSPLSSGNFSHLLYCLKPSIFYIKPLPKVGEIVSPKPLLKSFSYTEAFLECPQIRLSPSVICLYRNTEDLFLKIASTPLFIFLMFIFIL